MAIIFATATSDGLPITFKIVRGTRWQDELVLTDQATGSPIDLTGVTGILMRVRTTITTDTVLLELSVTNGKLTISDAANGVVDIDVSSVETNALPANNNARAKYVTDALIQRSASEWEPAISGKLIVYPSVSRPLDDA